MLKDAIVEILPLENLSPKLIKLILIKFVSSSLKLQKQARVQLWPDSLLFDYFIILLLLVNTTNYQRVCLKLLIARHNYKNENVYEVKQTP